MNASAFLATIDSEGVRLRRNGNELRIQTRRGASADAFIDLIRLNRDSLLATLAGEHDNIPWITADDLHWVHVNQREVDETVPPADWDGTLPADCAWLDLCTVLGPCPHTTEGRCRCQKRESPAAAVGRYDAEQVRIA
jgi:hypothetical protein